MKKTLAVFFGGQSAEHDVSIVTGLQFIENAYANYEIVPVYISREGGWYTGDALTDVEFYKNFDPNYAQSVYLEPNTAQQCLCVDSKGLFGKKTRRIPFDVAIPAMHGLGGEDGTLQGLFELNNVVYAQTGVLGSAAGMDKVVMKYAFLGMGLSALKGEFFTRDKWEVDKDSVLLALEGAFEYPMFVKPANLGSSIGISRADDRQGLEMAINVAASYDKRILVERGVTEMMEINCSALGYGANVRTSVCEQPISWKEFLTFEEKYLGGSSKGSKGMQSQNRRIPAPISDELSDEIKAVTEKVFRAFDCKGVVRIDYIYDTAEEKLYINEINTIPGSFAFYLWEHGGMSYPALIDAIVEQAYLAHQDKSKSVYAYDSQILSKAKLGTKGSKSSKR